MTMPLSLSDQQLALVQQAASMIPVHDRCHFLRSIANRIGDIAHPSDDDIREAVDLVLNCRGIAGGADAFVTRSNKFTQLAKGVFQR